MGKRKPLLAVTGAITVIVAAGVLLLRNPSVPDHAGKPIDVWFSGLCSGVYGGTPKASRFAESYAAFAKMESNAVPYLAQQLRYDRLGVRQKFVGYLRQHAVTRRFASNMMWPTERRNYAAVALGQMGPRAEAAIPALLEAWAHDAPEVKVNAVVALESIMRDRKTGGMSLAEWRTFSSDAVAEAVRRYPKVAEDLNIKLQPVHSVAEELKIDFQKFQ